MSPTVDVYVYVLVFTALVALAAAAIEWGLQGRVPLRRMWSAAIWIALVVPPAALVWRAAATDAPAKSGEAPGQYMVIKIDARSTQAMARHDGPFRLTVMPEQGLMARIARIGAKLTPTLTLVWLIASVALVAWLAIGALHWRRARRSWYRTSLDGVEVEVSPATGPAVLGVISHKIVMPEWAMSMTTEQRKLMLAHECEHVAAHDPQRLALAVLALVLMPWNAALWWCAARLRRAIELDCDARVLRRHPGAKEYGHMLLDIASRGQAFGPTGMPVVALLRLPSELELRLRAMTRPRSVAMRTLVIGGVVGLLAVTGAFAAPIPRMRLAAAASAARVLRHATPDTTQRVQPASADSMHILARRSDSLASIANQLARKAKQLAAAKAKLDSTDMALNATYARLRTTAARLAAINDTANRPLVRLGRSRSALGKEQASFARERLMFAREQAAFAREQAASDATRRNNLPAAIARYYPEIPDTATSAKQRTVLWFVVDSSGRVLRTTRSEGRNPAAPFSVQSVAGQFPGMNLHDVVSINVLPAMVGKNTVMVVWTTVGKP